MVNDPTMFRFSSLCLTFNRCSVHGLGWGTWYAFLYRHSVENWKIILLNVLLRHMFFTCQSLIESQSLFRIATWRRWLFFDPENCTDIIANAVDKTSCNGAFNDFLVGYIQASCSLSWAMQVYESLFRLAAVHFSERWVSFEHVVSLFMT